jgi:hypothetical protein
MRTSHHYTRRSRFEPTLESEALPVVGGDRTRRRAIAWQRIAAALAGFWIIAIALAVAAFA